jgi:hypothetical protein
MKEPARLIIPVWGEAYIRKLLSITLPAVLAPGNLPALSEFFDVELVIVTETRLFDLVRNSPSFQSAQRLGAARLVALDDLLLDDPSDYGAVLTHALFRGFVDLGAAMTETFLLFLNADFIISECSLGHLAQLMRQGMRVIHAPSFRVVLEAVTPQLEARVDAAIGTLRISSRDMVRLALANKHRTVKARTVNQRLSHQTWMDQYYWYVDEQTLIGYQWPVALVAIKPERVVTAPVLVWDYGFIPEAAPSAERHFIGDSDEFFMIELQGREAGQAMIRPGWISIDNIARNLSTWTTKEQRECGRQLLKIHAEDLPPDIDVTIAESQAYMDDVYRRLANPVPHDVGHPLLGPWFDGATKRMRGREQPADAIQANSNTLLVQRRFSSTARGFVKVVLECFETVYRRMFCSPPPFNMFHPMWVTSSPMVQRLRAWQQAGGQKIFWIGFADSPLNWLLSERIEPAFFLNAKTQDALAAKAPYDYCICELALSQLADLDRLYGKIRPLVGDGGHILVSVVKDSNMLDSAELLLERTSLPSVDISEIHFFGTPLTWLLRRMYLRLVHRFPTRPMLRDLIGAMFLVACAPITRLANSRAARRNSTIFSQAWTAFVIDFTVKRAHPQQRGAPAERPQLTAAGPAV